MAELRAHPKWTQITEIARKIAKATLGCPYYGLRSSLMTAMESLWCWDCYGITAGRSDYAVGQNMKVYGSVLLWTSQQFFAREAI